MELIPGKALHLNVCKDLIRFFWSNSFVILSMKKDTQDMRPLNKFKKSCSDIDQYMESNTSQVMWMLQNRVATSRMNETASSATVLLSGMSSSPPSTLQHVARLAR